MKILGLKGIETRPFFKKISSMPFYQEVENKVSTHLSETGLNVPSYPDLMDDDIKLICSKIKYFLKNNL